MIENQDFIVTIPLEFRDVMHLNFSFNITSIALTVQSTLSKTDTFVTPKVSVL